MTPEEALQHGKCYEPITLREVATFDADSYYADRGTKIVAMYIPATDPGHEHGYSKEHHEEALKASREGRIRWKVL